MTCYRVMVLLLTIAFCAAARAEENIAWEMKKYKPISTVELQDKYGIDLPEIVPIENLSGQDLQLSAEARTNRYSISPFDLNGDGVDEIFIFAYRMDKCGAYNCPVLFYAKDRTGKYRLVQEFIGMDGIRFAQGKDEYGLIGFPRPLAQIEDGKEWYDWRWDGKQYKEIP